MNHAVSRGRRIVLLGAFLCAVWLTGSLEAQNKTRAEKTLWRPLFDGKTLGGWKTCEFGGDGEVKVKNRSLVIEMGEMLTGIQFTRQFPKTNYEISLDAMRLEGIDFFCGLTFPVEDSHCSFIVGGWAGAVVGLSSIDGKDASENETTKYIAFKEKKWYAIMVRVTPEKIVCWIDKKKVVDQKISRRRISTRNEIDLCKPLGLATWQTTAAIRKIQWRPLKK